MSKKFCEICLEKRANDQIFTVQRCKHFFCTDCMAEYVKTKVMSDNVTDVKCPAIGCKLGRLDIANSSKDIVSNECLTKWNELYCGSQLFLDNPNYKKFYCPYKNCSGLLLWDTDEVIMEAECPHCRRLFCARCRVPWHSEMLCDEFQQLEEDEKVEENRMFRQLVKTKKWTKCPECLYYVEKIDGCSCITCRCGSRFCYRCGARWSNTHICLIT